MEKAKIKILSITSESSYTCENVGTILEKDGTITLTVCEEGENPEIKNVIEFSTTQNFFKVKRFGEIISDLEFFPNKKGTINLDTPYGNLVGEITTKKYSMKKISSGYMMFISFETSFDSSEEELKRIYVTYSTI